MYFDPIKSIISHPQCTLDLQPTTTNNPGAETQGTRKITDTRREKSKEREKEG
jgi:hypothetical protein